MTMVLVNLSLVNLSFIKLAMKTCDFCDCFCVIVIPGFDDVIAEFRYTRFGISTTYRLCGELGTNFWTAAETVNL